MQSGGRGSGERRRTPGSAGSLRAASGVEKAFPEGLTSPGHPIRALSFSWISRAPSSLGSKPGAQQQPHPLRVTCSPGCLSPSPPGEGARLPSETLRGPRKEPQASWRCWRLRAGTWVLAELPRCWPAALRLVPSAPSTHGAHPRLWHPPVLHLCIYRSVSPFCLFFFSFILVFRSQIQVKSEGICLTSFARCDVLDVHPCCLKC